jgi:hypothetical protein
MAGNVTDGVWFGGSAANQGMFTAGSCAVASGLILYKMAIGFGEVADVGFNRKHPA